jgi:hypothetical protein
MNSRLGRLATLFDVHFFDFVRLKKPFDSLRGTERVFRSAPSAAAFPPPWEEPTRPKSREAVVLPVYQQKKASFGSIARGRAPRGSRGTRWIRSRALKGEPLSIQEKPLRKVLDSAPNRILSVIVKSALTHARTCKDGIGQIRRGLKVNLGLLDKSLLALQNPAEQNLSSQWAGCPQ